MKNIQVKNKKSSRFRSLFLAFALTLVALPFTQGEVFAFEDSVGGTSGGTGDNGFGLVGGEVNVGGYVDNHNGGKSDYAYDSVIGNDNVVWVSPDADGGCSAVVDDDTRFHGTGVGIISSSSSCGGISAPSDGPPPPPPPYTEKWEYYIHYTGEKNKDICSQSSASEPWQDPKYQYERMKTGPASFGTTESFSRGGVYLIKAVPVSQYGVRNWNGEAKQFWISVNNDVTGKTLSLPAESCKQKSIPGLSGGGMVQDGFINKDSKVQNERGIFNGRQERYREYIKNYGG